MYVRGFKDSKFFKFKDTFRRFLFFLNNDARVWPWVLMSIGQDVNDDKSKRIMTTIKSNVTRTLGWRLRFCRISFCIPWFNHIVLNSDMAMRHVHNLPPTNEAPISWERGNAWQQAFSRRKTCPTIRKAQKTLIERLDNPKETFSENPT